MPARASRRQKRADFAEIAFRVVQEATGQRERAQAVTTDTPFPPLAAEAVRAAATALSRLGASKGGKARAAALSAKERKVIANKAARSRWGR